MNKVRGRQGKGEATGFTLLKSWDAFESEVAKIWTNAREYNEDGSDMFLLAGEFEVRPSLLSLWTLLIGFSHRNISKDDLRKQRSTFTSRLSPS